MAEALTEAELKALSLTRDLVNLMAEIVGDGPSREGDMAEIVQHVHVLQRMLMSQAAARAYPYEFRLLGELVRKPEDEGGERSTRSPQPKLPSA